MAIILEKKLCKIEHFLIANFLSCQRILSNSSGYERISNRQQDLLMQAANRHFFFW